MAKVLFFPLNTNHTMIFHTISKWLDQEFFMLSHDNISDAKQYRTEELLRKLEIPFIHFGKKIERLPGENIGKKILHFFQTQSEIKKILKETSPDLVVLGIDHDPIAQTMIKECKRMGIKTILFQEGLILPYQYTTKKYFLSDYLYRFLNQCGLYLTYTIPYGAGGCDKIGVGGKLPCEILVKRGIPIEKIEIVGVPKYDSFFEKIKNIKTLDVDKRTYLYAARPTIIQDEMNIRFLNKLVESTKKLDIHLIIKLHPRSPLQTSEVYDAISIKDSSLEIIKEGDDTFEILKRSYALVTDFSTVALEALILGKESIAASYLAGENRFDYYRYDAIYTIENEDEIYSVLKESLLNKKSNENKIKLLKDEFYKLDGQSGKRAAKFIENEILT